MLRPVAGLSEFRRRMPVVVYSVSSLVQGANICIFPLPNLFVAVNSTFQKEKASCNRIEYKIVLDDYDTYKLYVLYCKTVGQSMWCKLQQSMF